MTKIRLTSEQQALAHEHYPLAKYLARLAWTKNRERLDKDELVSVAYEGLVSAASRFDPSRSDSFSAYARTRINGAIIDWQRSQDHVRRSERTDYKRLVQEGFNAENVGTPSFEVLAERSGLSVERVQKVVNAVLMAPLSIDALQWDNSGDEEENSNNARLNVTEPDRVTMSAPQPEAVETSAIVGHVTSGVVLTIRALTPLQQAIVALRYYSGYELQVISTRLDVSMDTVRQAHADAIDEIRAAMMRSVQH